MSAKGDLEKVKQIFSYVNKENTSVDELGVKNNEANKNFYFINLFSKLIKEKEKQRLVDIKSDFKGRTPLITAAACGHHQICQYLISEQKANLEARDYVQGTALIHAVKHCEVIKVLLKYNANCKAKDKIGSHAAYWAAKFGHLDALKMLVEEDGDVIDLKGWNGQTPLIAASIYGRVDVCKYLVEEKNANVNLKDDDGKTALQHTSIQQTSIKNMDIIRILRKEGLSN